MLWLAAAAGPEQCSALRLVHFVWRCGHVPQHMPGSQVGRLYLKMFIAGQVFLCVQPQLCVHLVGGEHCCQQVQQTPELGQPAGAHLAL